MYSHEPKKDKAVHGAFIISECVIYFLEPEGQKCVQITYRKNHLRI